MAATRTAQRSDTSGVCQLRRLAYRDTAKGQCHVFMLVNKTAYGYSSNRQKGSIPERAARNFCKPKASRGVWPENRLQICQVHRLTFPFDASIILRRCSDHFGLRLPRFVPFLFFHSLRILASSFRVYRSAREVTTRSYLSM